MKTLVCAAAAAVVASGCGPAAPVWSPETATLLFMSKHEGNAEIYLKHGRDTTLVNLTRHPAVDNWPAWSPDGGRIAFHTTRNGKLDVYRMDADGSDTLRLTDHQEHDYLPSWTPDGESIAFTSWRTEEGDTGRAPHFYLMGADGSDERRFNEESPGTSTGTAWSPDGRTVLFTRGRVLVIADAAGGPETTLTDDDIYAGGGVFSPDGGRIAFSASSDSSSDIVVMNADGSERRTVVRGGWNYYPSWSPDGRWLTYTATINADDDDYDIFAVTLEGNPVPVLLAGGPGRQTEGSWKPRP